MKMILPYQQVHHTKIPLIGNLEKKINPLDKYAISIIIPHLKGQDVLIECLESIYNYTQNIQYEIIVIDNNVQDGSLDDINKKFPDLKIIASKENKGYAGGCNLGAQNAQSDYLLFLNNDTIIQKNTIENLLSFARNGKLLYEVNLQKGY